MINQSHHHGGIDGFDGKPVEAKHNAVGEMELSTRAGIVAMRDLIRAKGWKEMEGRRE